MSFLQISYNLSENGHGHFTKETQDLGRKVYNVFTLGTVCNVVS